MENFSEMTEKGIIYSRVFQKGRDMIECSRDFILPDLYADIKRVISSSGSIYPEECFVESGKVSVNGTLTARMLFVDDEGALRSATFAQDYSASFPVSDVDSEDDILVVCCPTLESVSVKTVNPRKVSVRGRIDAGIKLWKKVSVDPEAPEFECECDTCVETKTEKISCMVPFSAEERELDVSDDILLDNEIDEIIYCDASIETVETVARDGALDVKGNINTDIVYISRASSDPIHVSKRIPFSNSVNVEGAPSDSSVFSACPYIRSVECEIAHAEGGDKIEIDVSYALIVNGASVVDCAYVCDAYMPAYEFETESERIGFSSDPEKTPKSVKMRSCAKDVLPEGSKVMLATAQTQIESIASENGKKSAMGSVGLNVVYKNPDGAVSSYSFSDSFEIDLSDISDFNEYVFLMRMSPISVKNEQDGLCAEYDINADVISWKSGSGEMIRASRVIAPEHTDEKKPFIIYYPSKDESLWDVGKKYNVNVQSLISANPEIDGENLPKVLLIPRARTISKNKIIF